MKQIDYEILFFCCCKYIKISVKLTITPKHTTLNVMLILQRYNMQKLSLRIFILFRLFPIFNSNKILISTNLD